MTRVKVGVIGAGYWGPNLIRNFYQLPDADLQMLCDLRPERLKHMKELYPEVHVTKNLDELLASDVEAIAIATPVSSHYPLAMKCLKAGKNILIEKPITDNSPQAREIVQTGKALGKTVMVGHTFVYNPAVIALRELITSGEIGEVYYVNGTRVNLGLYQPDTNVVWDLAPHDVSILQYILGQDPQFASARGGQFAKAGVYDVAYITLYYQDGIMADLRVSWLDPCKIRRITIVGSKKMIVYDDILANDKVKIYDKGVTVQPYNDTYEEFMLAYRYGDEMNYPLEWAEPLRLECQSFVDSVRNGKQTKSDGDLALRVVQTLEAAQYSLFNGHTKEEISYDR